jgi:hypothetical protein
MKRKRLVSVCSIIFSLLLLSSCQKPAEDTNSAAPAANTNSSGETVDRATVEAELTRIENDWPRVIKERDAEAIKRVEADDAIFVYPDGSVGDKNTDVKDAETGALSADSWEVTDLKVNVLSNDAAVASGRSVVKNGKYKMPDGKSMDISGQYRFVDTFARRGGEWKLVAGVSTKIQEPMAGAAPTASASPSAKTSPATAASPALRPLTPIRVVPPIRKVSPAATPNP